jgi:hypothetical protein
MPDYTYPAVAVLVETTGELAATGTTGVLRPAAGQPSVPTYDLNGSPRPIVVGPKGASPAFTADIRHGVLDFGSVQIPVVSDQARDAAIDVQETADQALIEAVAAREAADLALAGVTGDVLSVVEAAPTVTPAGVWDFSGADVDLRDRSSHTGTQPVASLGDATSIGRSVATADSPQEARTVMSAVAGYGITELRAITADDYAALTSPADTAIYFTVAELAEEEPPAPVATFTYSATGLTLSVDGSGSSTAAFGASIASYAWDFGDGATATGPVATRTYAAGGTFQVTLVVTDDNGKSSNQTQGVTVTAPTQPLPVTSPVVYSTSGDRTNPVTLAGKTDLSGQIYVFVPAGPGIARVDFNLDNGFRAYGEAFAPYDLMGAGDASSNFAALPLDLSTLGAGTHTLTTVVQYSDGVASQAHTDTFTVSATAPLPEPEPTDPENPDPVDPTDLDASYATAWATKNIETMRRWYLDNLAPRRIPRTGTVGATTVTTQAQADALRGKTITGRLTVSAVVTIEQITMRGADIRVNGNAHLTLRHALLDGGGNTGLTGMMEVHQNSRVTLEFVEIVRHYDGLRLYGTGGLMYGKYIFMHSMATSNPAGHHQDGVQQMAGQVRMDRIFIDGRGANTSTFMVKPDVSTSTLTDINESTLFGAPLRAHTKSGTVNNPQNVDYSGNLIGDSYGNIVLDIYQLMNPTRAAVLSQQVHVPGKGLRTLVHGTRSL